ncbi:MAG: hypothetical protein KJP26_09435, partial [Maribacter sp.]|nr:hypothetical protein [Maribacter sp.]
PTSRKIIRSRPSIQILFLYKVHQNVPIRCLYNIPMNFITRKKTNPIRAIPFQRPLTIAPKRVQI